MSPGFRYWEVECTVIRIGYPGVKPLSVSPVLKAIIQLSSLSLVGACSNCPMASVTLEDGIETALINEIPEVVKVVNED